MNDPYMELAFAAIIAALSCNSEEEKEIILKELKEEKENLDRKYSNIYRIQKE